MTDTTRGPEQRTDKLPVTADLATGGNPVPTSTEPDVEPTEDTPTELDETTTAEETVETETEEPDTFPRSYVEELRQENGRYRQRAQRADDLAQRLHTALVAATGRLADPGDLDFDEAHIDDEGALRTALDDLLARKPHLASRRPRGDVGQGVTGTSGAVDLAGLLRSRA